MAPCLALHEVLFRAMEQSLAHEDDILQDCISLGGVPIPSDTRTFLLRDMFNYNISVIADEAANTYGSYPLRSANEALNAWRRNWDARRVRDVYSSDGSGAFSHPMNFWLLAKVLIVAHFFRNRVSSTGDSGSAGTDELSAFFRASKTANANDRIQAQLQVIQWLTMIRQHRDGRPLASESFLSQVMDGE